MFRVYDKSLGFFSNCKGVFEGLMSIVVWLDKCLFEDFLVFIEKID